MKKVILFGDSISSGYREYVKQALAGVAEIYYPTKANGAFAQNLLRFMNVWAEEEGFPRDADLVHFNATLWDVLRIYGDDTLTSPEYYAELLPRIVKRIKDIFPKAQIAFATGTTVVEEDYEPPYARLNSDIEKFNSIALGVLSPLGVKIDDLYSVTKNLPQGSEYRSDMTHFSTPQGVELLGGTVVNFICSVLSLPMPKPILAVVPDIPPEILGN